MLDPLNVPGDREGAQWLPGGTVKTPAGFKDAYEQYCANGWNGLTKNPEYGGQGLPQLVATAVEEMWHASNLAFDLCPLLTQGAIEAIELRGTQELKDTFLPKMVAGTWTGTMNLTEPQAGSDLAAVRTRAVPQGDGTYKLFGQKIFITFGEHDYTENIIHLVLARTPDAPEGVKGISLFVVPKFIVNDDGSLGARNDVHCVSLEHKLGIHASPTCVLAYGDNGGAIGYLVGEENRGLEYMFIMMNLARFSVGLEGVGISERAYQRAVAYARDRVQGKARGPREGREGRRDHRASGHPAHADDDARVHRSHARGRVRHGRGARQRARATRTRRRARKHQAFVDFMIPIVKGWSTEIAQEVTSLGVQVHGGMGFIEETGAAQHYRDARIITIYEGTTGIQANDLIGRKTARDGGAVRAPCRGRDRQGRGEARRAHGTGAAGDRRAARGRDRGRCRRRSTGWCRPTGTQPRAAHAGAVAYLELWGLVAGGWQMGRAALIARSAWPPAKATRVPAREDRDGALLRGRAAAAGVGARAHGHPRRRERARARRGGVLTRRPHRCAAGASRAWPRCVTLLVAGVAAGAAVAFAQRAAGRAADRPRAVPGRLQQRRAGLHARAAPGEPVRGLLGRRAGRRHAALRDGPARRSRARVRRAADAARRLGTVRALRGRDGHVREPRLLSDGRRQSRAPTTLLPTGNVVPRMQRGAERADLPGGSGAVAGAAVLARLSGSPLSGDYIEALKFFASHGYVVVAPFHGDLRFADLELDGFEDAFYALPQLQDVRRDAGGAAAVAVVRARRRARPSGLPRPRRRRERRRLRREPGRRVAAADGRRGADDDAWASRRTRVTLDPRLKAAVGYVPYFGIDVYPAFGRDLNGLDGVALPYLAISGTADTTAPIGVVERRRAPARTARASSSR